MAVAITGDGVSPQGAGVTWPLATGGEGGAVHEFKFKQKQNFGETFHSWTGLLGVRVGYSFGSHQPKYCDSDDNLVPVRITCLNC